MDTLPWIILLLPLFSAAGITIFTQKNRDLSAKLSIGAVGVGFVLSLILFVSYRGEAVPTQQIEWINLGKLGIDIGIQLDAISQLMLLIVTGVGGLIHIYSYGYMREDRSVSRFFASLSLFTFSMLGIVLASNFVQMFIFWELVGLSSYLLIGFWYERPSAADAAKKAFITNRLGDFGFILGIIIIWALLGTVSFDVARDKLAADPALLGSMATVAGLLIFCGAMGKSAQFPLHVWLPDAMEGPTPVSALIHAATMVAAGVYMLCRTFFLFEVPQAWPEAVLGWFPFLEGITALGIIAWIGGITALLAALIAVQQDDIKRVLAYSTLSQLGYMVMAVGLAAPVAAMYHLTTHAFFKALLFLGAGSVIHAMHHQQDMWEMGGLKAKLPTTYWTFMVGTLALCGVPPFSGFYSKDAVLAAALDGHHGSPLLFVLGVGVAVLTAFYMFRLLITTFYGQARSEHAEHAHESPRVMTLPLVLLAVPSLLAGLWGIDAFAAKMLPVSHPIEHHGWFHAVLEPVNHSPLAATFGLLAVLVGALGAWHLYRGVERDPVERRRPVLSDFMRQRFFFDEIYQFFIGLTHELIARISSWLDQWIVGGLIVRGTAIGVEITGRLLRLVQTGNIQTYALLLVAGIVLVIVMTIRATTH
ncbi:MAG TPA: NADH-quinone oxidoreductase subunit L [Verrucomicrobiales bacterium]|nr:NADH-quinone oxidoreductase subunit L [Verrucomicrobiales bacterium]